MGSAGILLGSPDRARHQADTTQGQWAVQGYYWDLQTEPDTRQTQHRDNGQCRDTIGISRQSQTPGRHNTGTMGSAGILLGSPDRARHQADTTQGQWAVQGYNTGQTQHRDNGQCRDTIG